MCETLVRVNSGVEKTSWEAIAQIQAICKGDLNLCDRRRDEESNSIVAQELESIGPDARLEVAGGGEK